MTRKHLLGALGAVLAVGAAAFVASASSGTARPVSDDPNNAKLTYWYWAESDAPGANGWLKKEVALYEKAHPKVQDHDRPAVHRHADLGVHDRGPDQERAGHRDAVGDAAGADTGLERCQRADLRLCAGQRDQELDRHGREQVGREALGDAPVSARHPIYLEQGDVQEGWPEPEQGAEDLGRVPGRRQEAQGSRLYAVRHGQQGRVRRRVVLLADRQAEPQLDGRAEGRHDRQGQFLGPEVLGLLRPARQPQEEGIPQLRRRVDQPSIRA